MKFEDFKGMPSGKDYGVVIEWALLDGDDFTVAFFAKGNPFQGDISDDVFTWVVETKQGETVYLSNEQPIRRPIFGLDQREWCDFQERVLPIVDEWIEENK